MRQKWRIYVSDDTGVHAAASRDPHADQATQWAGTATRAETSQPGPARSPAPDRACQQECEALSHRQRPDPPLEGGRPRSRDGTLLCPAQLPAAPDPLAANGLIGINSILIET